MKKFKTCVNGCDAPISPPSKVLCQGCMDQITKKIEGIAKRLEDSVMKAAKE